MLEAAGGGGGTDWWGMDMEMIHSLSQNPDIDAQYQIVDGWQKSADLIADHMGQVQDYRNALAAAWPPEKSSAAATYLARLDGLLKNLNETYEAALSNRDALSSASLSLSLAKTEMAKIYSQWDTNNKALVTFNQQQSQKKQQIETGKPLPSPSPSGDEPPPVTAAQQESLRQRAITLMSSVSSDLAEAQLKVVRPAPYNPADYLSKNTDPSGPRTANVPVLPPLVPTSYSGGNSRGTGGGISSPSHSAITFPTSATSPPPGTTLPGGTGNGPGLVLGGTNPPSAAPSPSTGLTPITNAPGGGPITNPGALPPSTGPFLPNGNLPPAGSGNVAGNGNFRPIDSNLFKGELRAMPPGGIIGKMPGSILGEPGATRFGTQRVNPVGGVIGEGVDGRSNSGFIGESLGGRRGAGPAAHSGMRSTAADRPYSQFGGRRSDRRDQSEGLGWDPDNPWVTEVGIDPVVLPLAEQRIDPGPAIGLD